MLEALFVNFFFFQILAKYVHNNVFFFLLLSHFFAILDNSGGSQITPETGLSLLSLLGTRTEKLFAAKQLCTVVRVSGIVCWQLFAGHAVGSRPIF